MTIDLKRELLRHIIATIIFRAQIAVRDAPESFAAFKIDETVRTPAEILAHMGDLLEGSLSILKGELVYLDSKPLAWKDELKRFFSAAKAFDAFLASSAPLSIEIEKITQGPVADALTHVGQIVLLRRAAGVPVSVESYFTAEIVPDEIYKEFLK